MANDPTVKAGSWGPKTVEKILRIQERALSLSVPMVYLVDSAGARITEQVQMFPGRRGAGRIFHNQVKLSGVVPQVCVLFGPQRRRRRLHPGVLRHRDHARGQRLDVPRLAAHGGDGDRREGHASRRWAGRACTRASPDAATNWSRPTRTGSSAHAAISPIFQATGRSDPPLARAAPPRAQPDGRAIGELIPADENKPFDIKTLIDALVDEGSLMEIHPRWAKELVVGFARLDGQRGRDRRQPAEAQGRRAVLRLRRQGRALHLELQRLQRAAAVPRRRARAS